MSEGHPPHEGGVQQEMPEEPRHEAGHVYDQPYAQQPPAAPSQYGAPAERIVEVRRTSPWTMVAAAIFGGLVGGALLLGTLLVIGGAQDFANVLRQETGQPSQSQSQGTTTQPPIATDIETVSKEVLPSVVNVSVAGATFDPFGGTQELQGNGSGVIIRSDGYILTNNHVVESASRISVNLGNEEVPAKVIGRDPASDLAVIKIEKTGLQAAKLGDSENLVIGQPVLAIGSPFGLEKTVTSGIVSALHRSATAGAGGGQSGFTAYVNLIQTDAAINPGNSGGALVNLAAEVVGINTLIQSTSGANAGIGFAIPSAFAQEVADQLITTGKVVHPYMGVSTVSVDESLKQQLDLTVDSGALVQLVEPGSPADKAGIKKGDVIVRIGDMPVKEFTDVFAAVRQSKVGDTIEVEVIRGGKSMTFNVTLAERPPGQ